MKNEKRISTVDVYGDIRTESKVINSLNILEVEIGTDAKRDQSCGDHDAGTYFGLKNIASTNWSVMITSNGATVEVMPEKIGINMIGVTEAHTLAEALRFAADTIERQMSK